MIDRREFLQGATVSALSMTAVLPSMASAHIRVPLTLDSVLIDDRHAESRAFGARFAGRGVAVRAVPEGDVTQLWLSEIGPAWRRGSAAVAGLTRRPVLFCLEQLAWAHGLRVVFHAEHIVSSAGSTQHQVLRCLGKENDLALGELALLGSRWPARVADLVAEQSRHPRGQRAGPTCASLEPTLPPGAELLTSWIIMAT
jgi:hypothetical protein